MDELSHSHTVPLNKWLEEGVVFKFWGDNVDKKRHVRDLRADNKGEMVHMFSIRTGRSRIPAPNLPHGPRDMSVIEQLPATLFLPSSSDVSASLLNIISRLLPQYITGLAPLAKIVPKHILHDYSKEMAQKSEVYALDVLMKNEAKHDDMISIMRTLQGYLGDNYCDQRIVACGG